MDWATNPRADPTAAPDYAHFSTTARPSSSDICITSSAVGPTAMPAHINHPEFSSMGIGLIAPLSTHPAITAHQEWPVAPMPGSRVDHRHDMPFEISASADPDFDTDSVNHHLNIRDVDDDDDQVVDDDDDDDVQSTSYPRRPASTTEETSLVTESEKRLNILNQSQSPSQTQTQLQTLTPTPTPTPTPSQPQPSPVSGQQHQPVRNDTQTHTKRSAANTDNAKKLSTSNDMTASATTTGTSVSLPPQRRQLPLSTQTATQRAPKNEAVFEPRAGNQRPMEGSDPNTGVFAAEGSEGAVTTPSNGTGTNSGSYKASGAVSPRSPSLGLSKASKGISKRRGGGAGKTTSSNGAQGSKKGGSSAAIIGVSPATESASASVGGTPGGGGTGNSASGLSHTKLCRDRLNNMFDRLKHTLPPAPPGVEVKHKAQVLDYAIMVFKNMVERTSQLEIELAVSSNKATMDWISKLVARTDTFPEAAAEVMRLFIRRRGWLHAELWTCSKSKPTSPTPSASRGNSSSSSWEDSILLSFCNAVVNQPLVNATGVSLMPFSNESKMFHFRTGESVQGRVWSSMRPEWVTGLSDPKNFRRADLARRYGLKVCLAVPVTITGKIDGIMCFYDVRHRPYDTQCLELAMRLAWALGNSIGGKRAKVNMLTSTSTT